MPFQKVFNSKFQSVPQHTSYSIRTSLSLFAVDTAQILQRSQYCRHCSILSTTENSLIDSQIVGLFGMNIICSIFEKRYRDTHNNACDGKGKSSVPMRQKGRGVGVTTLRTLRFIKKYLMFIDLFS